jgi:hypothetical protein
MPIDVKCPGCGERLRVPDRMAGRRSRCPRCKVEIQVPEMAGPERQSVSAAPGAKAIPAVRRPPVRAAAMAPEDEPAIAPKAVSPEGGVSVDVAAAGPTSTGGARNAPSRRKAIPLILIAAGGLLGLTLMIAVIVFGLTRGSTSNAPKAIAQASKAQPGKARGTEDEEVILLDEHGKPIARSRPGKKDGQESKTGAHQKKDGAGQPSGTAQGETPPKSKPREAPREEPDSPGSVKDRPSPAEKPGPDAEERPAEQEPEIVPEPKPDEGPGPDEMPAPEEKPEPGPPQPEVPPARPGDPVPPETDHTKVEVITLQPSPKPPAEKGKAPKARLGDDPSGKDSARPRTGRPGSKTRPKRAKEGDEAPALVAGPPDPNCPTCRGLGKIPLSPFRPCVHVEGMAPPAPDQTVPWRFCPKCQQGHDAQSLVEHEATRLKTALKTHQAWEQKTTWSLVRVETHLATVHAQLPPPEATKVGMALEMLAKHLQDVTRSMELTVTRPDDYEIIIIWEKQNHAQFLKLMEPEWAPLAGNNWGLLSQLGGSTIGRTSFFRVLQQGSPPPAHMAVSMAAMQQIARAAGNRAPVWLREGFAAYGENMVLGKNLVHSVDYVIPNVQLNPDWSLEMRRLAAMDRLKPWKAMFLLELRDYQVPEYVGSFSMVAYLISHEPTRFLDLVRAIQGGAEPEAALTQAYGKTVDQLQQGWIKWLRGGR